MLDARQQSAQFEESLTAQRERLSRDAMLLEYRIKRIDSALDMLNPQQGGTFKVVDADDQLYVRASDGDDFSVSSRNERQIAAFYDLLGITTCARIVRKEDFSDERSDQDLINPTYVICMPEFERHHLSAEPGGMEHVHLFPLGKCVRYQRRLTRSQSLRKDTFVALFEYLSDHGYRLRGDILLLPAFLNLDGRGSDVETLLVPIE